MRKLRCGIIGVGFVGAQHIEAVRRLGCVEVRALAASSEARARAKAERFGVERYYGNYLELLADKEIDVVHNCTPNYLHRPVIMAALEAGKHVISDKPLAINSEEAFELLQAARRARRVHALVFNYRFNPLVQQMRLMARGGALGDIYLVHGHYLQDWLLYPTDYNWRLDARRAGPARAVADIGSHWCDLAEFVTGLRIVEVLADLQTVHRERRRPRRELEAFAQAGANEELETYRVDTEDLAALLLRFSNRSIGAVAISQVSAGHKNHLVLEVNGSRGSLCWDQQRPNELWIRRRDKANELLLKDPTLLEPEAGRYAALPGGHNEAWADALKNLMASVYKFIGEGGSMETDPVDFPTFEDGYRSNCLIDAALSSHQRGNVWVRIQEPEY